MAQVNIRLDDTLKEKADVLFDELGLNMTTAFLMFVKQSLREGGIPFSITTKTDPFYSESNIKVLRASIANLEAGRGIVRKSIEELEELENG